MRVSTAVEVKTKSGQYSVHVESGSLDRIGSVLSTVPEVHRCALISDDSVVRLYGDRVEKSLAAGGFQTDVFTFPAGEEHKTRGTWETLTDQLIEAGFGRDSLVVALGGGVTGDLAGFVAATYLRGIPVLQVPTSVVAMVDSAVGGKTGVDTVAGKNLVGAFHPPVAVVVDPQTVGTLSRQQRSDGWVEAVKHGAIVDSGYFDRLCDDGSLLVDGEVEAVTHAVRRSIEVKAEVVSADEHESGARMVLNFGHTLGHAIEAVSGYALSHGAAVAVGMILEAELGERVGVTEEGTSERLLDALRAIEVIPRLPDPCPWLEIVGFLDRDKKARQGVARFVLLRRIGEVERDHGWSRPVDYREIEAALGSTRLRA